MKILLAGPQGSGKTTQAIKLSQRLGLEIIKAGDMVRQYIAGHSEKALEWREIVNSGGAIDNQVMADLLKAAFEKYPDNVVVDGYPRTLDQLELFDPHFDLVVYLHIPDELGIERLLERGRSDDTPEGIKRRLQWYHEETEPLLDYYRNLGLVIDIDSTQHIDQVTSDIISALEERADGINT